MKTILIAVTFLFTLGNNSSNALPPPEDIPEEILRTEIILLQARKFIKTFTGITVNPQF